MRSALKVAGWLPKLPGCIRVTDTDADAKAAMEEAKACGDTGSPGPAAEPAPGAPAVSESTSGAIAGSVAEPTSQPETAPNLATPVSTAVQQATQVRERGEDAGTDIPSLALLAGEEDGSLSTLTITRTTTVTVTSKPSAMIKKHRLRNTI
jgi:hypothetical protein